MKTKRYNHIKSILFSALLLCVFTACNQSDDYKYQIDPEAFSIEISSIYQITPDEAMELMFDSSAALFIDIREQNEFKKGHLENAINIPLPDLLHPEYKVLFDEALKDSLIVVLYGSNELQANAPWMLMYELGYTNVRLLLGGYSYIDRMYLGELKENETYDAEAPAYDFAKVIEEAKIKPAVIEEKVVVKKQVKTIQKPKKAAEGGC